MTGPRTASPFNAAGGGLAPPPNPNPMDPKMVQELLERTRQVELEAGIRSLRAFRATRRVGYTLLNWAWCSGCAVLAVWILHWFGWAPWS